jgi:hypothetical protein
MQMIVSSVKKTTTDFTIDCILSCKSGQKEKLQPFNKVLHNPWIPLKNSPALAVNPTLHLRKLNLQSPISSALNDNSSMPSDFIENLVKTTHRHTPIHNHANGVVSTSKNHLFGMHHFANAKLILPKLNVYQRKENFSDNQILSDEIGVVVLSSSSSSSSSSLCSIASSEYKCLICLRFFDSSDLLDVSLKI